MIIRILSLTILLINTAYAGRTYLGGGLSYTQASYTKEVFTTTTQNFEIDGDKLFKDQLPGANLLFGYQFNNHFATELSYKFFLGAELTNNDTGLKWQDTGKPLKTKGKITSHDIDLNLILSVPTYLVENNNYLLMGGIGYKISSWEIDYLSDNTVVNNATGDDGALKASFGLGTDYTFPDGLRIRFLANYSVFDELPGWDNQIAGHLSIIKLF